MANTPVRITSAVPAASIAAGKYSTTSAPERVQVAPLVDHPLVIALDAMGGDNVDKVPADVLGGAAITAERYPNARFLAFGDAASVKKSIDGNRILEGRVDIRPTKTVISNDAKPSSALRNGRSSSTWAAVEAVRDGEAAGVVSASNTGALMLISKSLLKTLPRIDRPAICSVFPTLRAEIVMLDLGATIKYNENNLFQFAVMGAAFATAVLGRKRPTVGLLNVGTEGSRATTRVREAAARLRQAADLPFEFRGFIEGQRHPGRRGGRGGDGRASPATSPSRRPRVLRVCTAPPSGRDSGAQSQAWPGTSLPGAPWPRSTSGSTPAFTTVPSSSASTVLWLRVTAIRTLSPSPTPLRSPSIWSSTGSRRYPSGLRGAVASRYGGLVSPSGARFAGVGACLPERVVGNDELAARVDTSDEWIRARTGIGQPPYRGRRRD